MRYITYVLLTGFVITSGAVYAADGISLGIGLSRDGTNIYRLSLRQEFEQELFENQSISIHNYFEFSSNSWSNNDEMINGIAFSPVFVFRSKAFSYSPVLPYIELGIGGNYNSNTMINNRNLSSRFQFEDRIGAGIRIQNFDLNLRYMHYSNAGLVLPNDGIDIFIFSLTYMIFSS
jgi:lipid A 3-O-deacylase